MEDWEHLHRRLSDATLAPYFGPYFKLLRGLYARGTRWFNRVVQGRYYTAQLSIKEHHLHVGLDPRDRAYFEFFTTGKPIVSGKFACIGVVATLEQGALTLTPGIRTGARAAHGQLISLVERPFQVQLIDEPVAELPPATKILQRPKYFNTLYQTWAPLHSHTGVHLTSYNHGRFTTSLVRTNDQASTEAFANVLPGMHGSFSAHATRDVGFDQWFQVGYKDRPIASVVLNDETATPPPDWPRASGVQTVVDEQWGTRQFAIYIDAFSQVSVFPTSQISGTPDAALDQNINKKYVKLVAPTLPAWVYAMSERFRDWYTAHASTGLVNFPENDWTINHLGTKACSVVYKRTAVIFDSAFWNTGVTGGTFSASDFGNYRDSYTGYGYRHESSVSGTAGQTRYISATGLLELGINITLTGANDEDFTLAITCTTVRDPETTDYCTLFAGYVWYDMVDGSAAAGDLCVWDIERYYRFPNKLPKVLVQVFATGPAAPFPVTFSAGDAPSDDWLRTLGGGGLDPERPFRTASALPGIDITHLPNPFDNPLPGRDHGGHTVPPNINNVTLEDLQPMAMDTRRTMYSLKNLTQATELKTFPAPPCGVARPQYFPPFVLGPSSTTWKWDNPFGFDSYSGSPYPADSGLPASSHMYVDGVVLTPLEPRAQFTAVDMKTLSFVLAFQTGTIDIGTHQRHVYHPGTAVYTFNTFREAFFPDTIPQPQKDKLTASMQQDFRAAFMHDSNGAWTFMTLAGGPPGKAGDVDWTDNEVGVLRYWVLQMEAWAVNPIAVLGEHPPLNTGFSPYTVVDPATAYWWGMLQTYGSTLNLTLISNPRFHWHMYADCIMNALACSPWSTFFVHPNGTWAFYDQSHVYNPCGIPTLEEISGSDGLTDYTVPTTKDVVWGTAPPGKAPGFDAALLEHCIYDRVHFEFAMPDNLKYSVDSRFVDLYNEAVKNAKDADIVPPGEVFNTIAPVDLKATFKKLPNGTFSPTGLSLQVKWGSNTYLWGDASMSFGPGYVASFGGNSGTIDLSLDYLFDGASPQASAQRITFSSCLVVETD